MRYNDRIPRGEGGGREEGSGEGGGGGVGVGVAIHAYLRYIAWLQVIWCFVLRYFC